jgi:hypothetical protein
VHNEVESHDRCVADTLLCYVTLKLVDMLTPKLVDMLTHKLVDVLTPKLVDMLTPKLVLYPQQLATRVAIYCRLIIERLRVTQRTERAQISHNHKRMLQSYCWSNAQSDTFR